MKRLLYAAAVLLFLSRSVTAQSALFDYLDASHFARAMRLGNTYAGVAQGPETMFYNAAGLADVNSYSINASSGQGSAFYVDNVDAYDFAAAIPVGKAGTLGASINSLVFNFSHNDDAVYRIYSLSYAHKLLSSLNVGLTANYYHLSEKEFTLIDMPPSDKMISISTFDINLAALYKAPVKLFAQDIFQIGFQFSNVLNRDVDLEYSIYKGKLFQDMRGGFAYTIVPELKPLYGFTPVKFMAAFDAVYTGYDYKFNSWQPNYGLELTLLDILQVSFGRENQKVLKKTIYSNVQYPASRYGFGLNIPLARILKLNYGLNLKFDYCKSDWQKINEDAGEFPGLYDRISFEDDALSIGLDVVVD